jgi:hypothetical protein
METGGQGSTNIEKLSSFLERIDYDSSSGDVKDATQRLSFQDFMLRQNRIMDRRARVFNGRQSLHVKRQALRHLRQQTDALETQFLSALEKRPTQRNVDHDPSLAELLKEIRGIKEKISREEHAYDKDENAVAIDEHALSVEEHQLFHAFAMSLFPNEIHMDQTFSVPVIPQRDHQTAVPAPNVPAPVHEYETKIGQANILRETLEELDFEREEYLEKEQRGLELDPDELEFLESYKESYEQSRYRLRKVEEEIKRLEPAALETGQLSPSARYIPILAAPSPLTLPAMIFNIDQQNTDSVSQISIDLQGLGDSRLGTANNQPAVVAGAGFPSRASIDRWLASLPILTQQVSKTTRAFTTFTTHEGSRLTQHCRDQVLGPRAPSSLPDCDQLRTGWVNVVETTPRFKSSFDNADSPTHPQNTERVDSGQSQTYKEVLKKFPELDLASTTAHTTRGQLSNPCNNGQMCYGG